MDTRNVWKSLKNSNSEPYVDRPLEYDGIGTENVDENQTDSIPKGVNNDISDYKHKSGVGVEKSYTADNDLNPYRVNSRVCKVYICRLKLHRRK